jgi:hypothetical protein
VEKAEWLMKAPEFKHHEEINWELIVTNTHCLHDPENFFAQYGVTRFV